jgi:hypothetical protein
MHAEQIRTSAMNTSNIPGFTAERSLRNHCERYHGGALVPASEALVVPAAYNLRCYEQAFVTTYVRCLQIGYGTGSCTAVADGLAKSVCRIGL